MTGQEQHDLTAAEYVLGLTDDVTRHRLDKRLNDDSVFAAEVLNWQKAFCGIDLLTHAVIPSSVVWQQIEQDLGRNAGVSGATSIRRHPGFWLGHIARNRAIDFLRKHENRCCSVDEISEAEAGFQMPLVSDESHAEARRLQHCMAHLPSEQRQSISLAYYRGLSQSEIALSMSQPEGTVKSWIRRALIHLRECIGL